MTLVIHIVTTIERGGAEAAVLQLAKQQVSWGHTVHVVPLKGNLDLLKQFEDHGVTVNLDLLNIRFLRQLYLARHLINRYKDALFHAHLPRSELLLSLISGRINFIVTRHNSEHFLPAPCENISPLISRWVLRKAKVVIAISSATESFLRNYKEVDLIKNVEVVYYGYKPTYVSPNFVSKSANDSYINTNILTIGRLAKQKNLLFALDVMFALKNDKQRFHFTIVGDGSQRKELEIRTLKLGLNDSVTFVGKTSDIFGFMSKSQVFLMTSLYEGFGLVNLEAMDYGLPVIAPFTSTFPEILGRDHPLFFEPNNVVSCVEKLKELFGYSHSQIESLQERQRSQMNRFSEQKYLERHNEIYARVICGEY